MERRKLLKDGTLGPLETVKPDEETSKEKMERLEAENAQFMYSDMMKGMKIEEIESTQADLVYQLMQKGVL